MIVPRHSIRRIRAELVGRFRFGGDSRSWLIVAKVSEDAGVPERPGTWVHSKPARKLRSRGSLKPA
jgi:hypothetical protein